MTASAQPKPDTVQDIAELRRALIENGYAPVPVKGKWPHFKRWQTMRMQVAQVDGYIRRYPDHTSTGILAGDIVAIDIDAPEAAIAEKLIARLMEIPGAAQAPCRIGKAPKCLYIFRATEPRRKLETGEYNVDGQKCQVEVLGSGNQFVAFGDHVETRKPYTWSNGDPLTLPLQDLPEITPEMVDTFLADADAILAAAGEALTKKAEPRQQQARGGDTFWQQVNSAALANPDAWVSALFSTARKETGTGAWRVTSKDLGRNLEEDISIHPDGIRDFGEERPTTPIQLVIDFGGAATTTIAAHWLCERLGRDPADFGWETRQPVTVRFDALLKRPTAANDDHEDWHKDERELFRSDSTLADLTHPGGFLEELIDWIVSSAEHPSRELALSAVIPFVGALIGRRFAGYRDARTNVYSIALAPSGYGKDHARQQIKRLTAAENLHAFAGPARLMSASGLRATLLEKPSISCMIDEIGGPLREMLDPRANQHQAMLKNDLLEYFSTASTYFEGAAYAQVRAVRLENPNLGIYGTSTPDDFWDAMSSLSTRDGFMARLVLFNVEGQKPALVVPARDVKDIPASIRKKAKALAMAGRSASVDVPAMDAGDKPRMARQVPLSAAAERRRLDFKGDIERKLAKASGSDATVLNRAVEHAVKLALIAAVATDWEKPEVTERQMTWAIQLAWLSCVSLMKESRLNVADSQREKNVNKILKLIQEGGESGISMGMLTDRTRGIDKRQREEILGDLTEAGRIRGEEHQPARAGGRPTIMLYMR